MPIYEFECTKCGHLKEVWMRLTDKPLAHCDQCHGKMRKLISQSTFHLKGSGWYVTDYASKSKSTPSTGEASGRSEQNTEAKTASTPEKASQGETVKAKEA